jgi:soluble lytic murein transglycosylase-like protein
MKLIWIALLVIGCNTDSAIYHIKRFYGLPVTTSKALIVSEAYRVAQKNKLSPSLLLALVETESSFRTKAESQKGARGLTQVMPFNAKRCGLHPDQLWDVSLNLACGAQILREEITRLKSIEKALAVYNSGKHWSKAGKAYAKKVLQLKKQIEEKHDKKRRNTQRKDNS